MSPYSYFSLSSKRSEVIIAPETTKTRFCDLTVVWRPIATQPPRISPWTLYRLKVDFVGYIFVADSMRLSSFKFSWRALKDARSTSRSAFWPFKVIRGRWFSCHLKALCDFLLVIDSNLAQLYLSPFLRYDDLSVENHKFSLHHLCSTPNLKMFPLH